MILETFIIFLSALIIICVLLGIFYKDNDTQKNVNTENIEAFTSKSRYGYIWIRTIYSRTIF